MIFGITVDHTNGGQLIHYYYAEMGLSALSPIFDHLHSLIPTSSILLQKKEMKYEPHPGVIEARTLVSRCLVPIIIMTIIRSIGGWAHFKK